MVVGTLETTTSVPLTSEGSVVMRSADSGRSVNQPFIVLRFTVTALLATVRTLQPRLQRCGPKARQADGSVDEKLCVKEQPRLLVGGRGVSGPVFLANAAYREYLFKNLQAQTIETLADGTTVQSYVKSPHGHADNPLSKAHVERKFMGLSREYCDGARAAQILAALFDLDKIRDAGEVMRLFVRQNAPS